MNVYEVLRRPLTTEKTYGLRDSMNAYSFEVHPDANKLEVKYAVEKIFEVSVVSVNVINVPAKRRRAGRRWIVRQAPRRKAVVRLAAGQSIRALETA
jgi:large subunit ribosomal protein L23